MDASSVPTAAVAARMLMPLGSADASLSAPSPPAISATASVPRNRPRLRSPNPNWELASFGSSTCIGPIER